MHHTAPQKCLNCLADRSALAPSTTGGFVGPGPSGSPAGSGARCHCTHVGDGVSVELGDGFQPLQGRNQLVVALHVNNGLSRRGETEKG